MRFLASKALLLFLTAALIAGCGSSGPVKSVGNISTITLAPSPAVSLNPGEVFQMQVSAVDSAGTTVFNQTFTFNSTMSAVIQVANNGLLCAGVWDSLTTPVNCYAPGTPGTPASGLAPVPVAGYSGSVSATAQGVNSNVVTVYVHQSVAALTLTPASPACVSQGGSVQYQVHALNANNVDISASIGTFNWEVTNATVGAPQNFTVTGNAKNTVVAKVPGLEQVFVSVGNQNPVNSIPVNFEECPVAVITLPGPITLAKAGATQTIKPTITDTLGKAVTSSALTWTSTEPQVATVAGGTVTAVAGGTAGILASCTPNVCNIGLNEAVYSNLLSASVPGGSGTTVYITCSVADTSCPATPVLTTIDTSNGNIASTITLPHKPNSMVFDRAGDKLFIGTSSGLILFDTSTKTVTATVTNAPGVVLAVSPDGNTVLVSSASIAPPGQIFLFNSQASSVSTFNIANASSADYTPDGFEALITSASTVYSLRSAASPQNFGIPGAVGAAAPTGPQQQIAVLANGALGYVAAPGVPYFPTCAETPVNTAASGNSPALIAAAPDNSGFVIVSASELDGIRNQLSGSGCSPTAASNNVFPHALSGVAPQQLIVTSDSHNAYVTNGSGPVITYAIKTDTLGSIALANGAGSTTGGASRDGLNIFVGGSDGQVHRINVGNAIDAQQYPISFSGAPNAIPDLVAVQP